MFLTDDSLGEMFVCIVRWRIWTLVLKSYAADSSVERMNRHPTATWHASMLRSFFHRRRHSFFYCLFYDCRSRVCACACVRVYVCACVRVCVCACVCVRVYMYINPQLNQLFSTKWRGSASLCSPLHFHPGCSLTVTKQGGITNQKWLSITTEE